MKLPILQVNGKTRYHKISGPTQREHGCSVTTDIDSRKILLGHTKLESTVRYLGIEVDDALEMSEQTEV
jgi:hypothetical protein